jgi:hypothetical protein
MTSLEGVPPRAVVGGDLHTGVSGGIRGLPLVTLANGTVIFACSPRAFSRFPPADHPVCRRPARQGAGQAMLVKMQRPAGRTILTSLAWSAGLSPGRWRTG